MLRGDKVLASKRPGPTLWLVLAPTDPEGLPDTFGVLWGEPRFIVGVPGEIEPNSINLFNCGRFVGLLWGLFLTVFHERAMSSYSCERLFLFFGVKTNFLLWINLIVGVCILVPLIWKSKDWILCWTSLNSKI